MKRISVHPLFYLLIIPLLGLIYTLINQESPQVKTLYTDLDHTIPFIKAFIIPYMIWMPFLYLTLIYFYFKDRNLYIRTLMAYTVSVLICYGIYLIFQTTVPRPELLQTDVLSRLVGFVYQNDAPFNCFPSIHCLSSYLLYRAARKSNQINGRTTTFIGVLAGSIMISTLFVKQHVVLDVFAAVILAHMVYSWVGKLNNKLVTWKRSDIAVQSLNNEVLK